jgi:hypothetical protein
VVAAPSSEPLPPVSSASPPTTRVNPSLSGWPRYLHCNSGWPGFLNITQLTFWTWEFFCHRVCAVRCRMFSCVPDLCLLDVPPQHHNQESKHWKLPLEQNYL